MAQTHSPTNGQTDWRSALHDGDEDAFRQHVEAHMQTLLKAARHDLTYYVRQGDLHRDDFTPEEVVGEALLQAWQRRDRVPEKMGLRAWLMSTLYRSLRGLVRRQKQYRHEKAISLDAPLPPDPETFDTQEWFWDWYQPDEYLTWEDVTPSQEPVDFEISLLDTEETLALEPESRHVLVMHDEFEMALPEVAFAMGRAVNETAELLEQARASLRERLVTSQPKDPATPAPLPSPRKD